MKPIYIPKGKAKEYGDYAINIYTGCPHECYYCFAPSVLRRDREKFHTNVAPREGIVEAVSEFVKELHKRFLFCGMHSNGEINETIKDVLKDFLKEKVGEN